MFNAKAFAFLGIFIALGTAIYLSNGSTEKDVKDIKDNTRVTDGYVYTVERVDDRGSNLSVTYRYTVDRKVINTSRSFDPEKYGRDYFLCKHFPVVYSAKHTDVSDLLKNRGDSIKYGIISEF